MNGNSNSTLSCPHCAGEHHGDACHEALITLNNVTMSWGGRDVLKDVDLVIRQGDFIAITGPNGGGKTTLLRIILGLLKPTRGKVERNISDLKIGYLPQKNMIDSHFPISVKEVVMTGLLASSHLSLKQKTQLCNETIASIGLTEHSEKAIGTLSGGQLQRALLGRAIISQPDVLVLDEPLSYLDKHFETRLYTLIEQLAKTTTIVLVSHEMSRIAGMANRHFIVDGNLRACASQHHFYSACEG